MGVKCEKCSNLKRAGEPVTQSPRLCCLKNAVQFWLYCRVQSCAWPVQASDDSRRASVRLLRALEQSDACPSPFCLSRPAPPIAARSHAHNPDCWQRPDRPIARRGFPESYKQRRAVRWVTSAPSLAQPLAYFSTACPVSLRARRIAHTVFALAPWAISLKNALEHFLEACPAQRCARCLGPERHQARQMQTRLKRMQSGIWQKISSFPSIAVVDQRTDIVRDLTSGVRGFCNQSRALILVEDIHRWTVHHLITLIGISRSALVAHAVTSGKRFNLTWRTRQANDMTHIECLYVSAHRFAHIARVIAKLLQRAHQAGQRSWTDVRAVGITKIDERYLVLKCLLSNGMALIAGQ